MKKGRFFLIAAVYAAILLGSGSVLAQEKMVLVNGEMRPAYRAGEVIVKYREGVHRSLRAMEDLYHRVNVVNVHRYGGEFTGFEQLTFDTTHNSVEQVVAELERDPSVEYAQPNYMLYAFPSKLEKPKTLSEPCLIPGIPFPPGCDDSGGGGGGEQPNPGTPCLIPGIPFPPGCDDSGGGNPPGNPGNPGNPKPGPKRPAIEPAPGEPTAAADPDLSKAWGIAKVSADKAWAKQAGSKDIIVAVIDTGIDYNHPDLAFNMWRNPSAASSLTTGVNYDGSNITGDVVGWDFVHNDNLPYDDNQHGTHCAGTVGAVGNDGRGISGVAQRVSLMAVKFLSAQGSGDTAAAIKSIDYAVSRGAKILSNSWGGSGDDGTNGALKESVVRAERAGVLFVAAAGNDGGDNDRRPVFPAAFDVENMLTVAATSETDGMAFFSNRGAKSVHVGAPGTNVYSTTPGGKYAKLSGTSMAAPHVSGAAAVVWSQFPDADYKEIKRRLMQTGDDLSALAGKTVTGKRINVERALQ